MNARWTRRATFILALTVALGGALSSDAFRMLQNNAVGRVTAGQLVTCDAAGEFTRWGLNNRNIAWQLNTGNQGAGKEAALRAAMGSWNNVFGTNYNLNLAGNAGGTFATDGVNTFRWATNEGCAGGCLALTALVLQAGQIIIESDITFNNSQTWRTNGNDCDTEAVAAHELGHSLGIHHSEVSGNPTMRATYFGNGGRSLEADDRAALQCSENRFGNPPPVPYITANPSSGTGPMPLTVTFDGTLSRDANGTITQYLWRFSDGTTATGPTAVRTYYGSWGVNAVYGVTLTVTDNQGLARATTSSVTLYCDDGQGGSTCFYQNF